MKKSKIKLITLGCSKNRVDSEHLLKQIEKSDIEISPESESVEDARADVLIINTCGFIKDAKVESIQAILEAVEAKKHGFTSKVLVFGVCLKDTGRSWLGQFPKLMGFMVCLTLNRLLLL
jgi:ribosomal protein S12 methylthiotransferase